MNKIFQHGRYLAGMSLAFTIGTAAQAQTLLDTPWYVSAGVGGVMPESLRDLDLGPQGRLIVGIPLRPQAYLEVNGFGFTADGKNGQPKETTYGGGVDLKLESLGERLNFLFIAGGGYAQAKRGGGNINAPYVNIGWGTELELGHALALRTELRGLARFKDDFIQNRGVTYDGLLTVGLTKRFGATPKAAAPYAPPPPPPPVAPAPAYQPPVLPPPVVPVAAAEPEQPAMPLRTLDLSKCASAPAGVKTDAEGCLVPQRTVLPRTRLFVGDSTRLSDEADDLLVPLVVSLRRDPALNLGLVVHTDTLGLQSTNLDLTVRMADQIRDRLLQYGVPESQVTAEGAGESQPIASEDTDAGRAKNRRIELNLRR